MGKPLGPQPENQSSQPTPTNTPQTSNGIVDERGRKIIPDIEVKKVRSDRRGDKMTVRGWVVNNSPDQIIRIDTTRLLKQKNQHYQEIGPNNSEELVLYDGDTPFNDNEKYAEIEYRLKQNNDVFMERYLVEYDLQSDGARLVEELHDDGPVRDI